MDLQTSYMVMNDIFVLILYFLIENFFLNYLFLILILDFLFHLLNYLKVLYGILNDLFQIFLLH